MHRSWLNSVAALLLSASSLAQSNAHSMLRPVTSAVRDAGVYHFGLGTWTRHADTTNSVVGDILYSNTCPIGYFAPLYPNEYVTDEGRVPGPNGPVLCDTGLASTNAGCQCSYTVAGFQIGYCSGIPGFASVSVNIGFQSSYHTCNVPNPLPQSPGTFDLTGLPGAGVSIHNCWLVTVDLASASQSFTISADGASCTWLATGDAATNHLFGWTFQNLTPGTGTVTRYVGPLIAGMGLSQNPPCSMVDNTRWDTLTCANEGGGPAKWPNNLTEDGWGMDTQIEFRDDTTSSTGGPLSPPCGPGCYYFNDFPPGSFHLRLFGEANCPPPEPAIPECRPEIDFITPCPCNANQPTTSGAGCNALGPGNVLTGGAVLHSAGTASLSGTNPGVDTLQFHLEDLPTNASESAFLLQGPSLLALPLTFGQGLRCVTGVLKRLQLHSPASGTSTWPAPGDFAPTIQARSAQVGDPLAPGSVRHYFIQYRQSLLIPPCVFPADFNTSNAVMVSWAP
jgi:hypothetical protein